MVGLPTPAISKKQKEAILKERSQSASNQLGEIYREEWQRWMDQFLPIDRELMGMATGQEMVQKAEDSARMSTAIGFGQARDADRLHREGLGLSMADDERRYMEGRSQRAEQSSLAGNLNNARMHAQDQQMRIMTGGMTSGLSDLTRMN